MSNWRPLCLFVVAQIRIMKSSVNSNIEIISSKFYLSLKLKNTIFQVLNILTEKLQKGAMYSLNGTEFKVSSNYIWKCHAK